MKTLTLATVFAALALLSRAQEEATEETCLGRPTLTCHLTPTNATVDDAPSNVRGGISLSPFWRDDQCYTRMAGSVTGLGDDTPHGVHIHELGDISAPNGSSTGGHYNPFDQDHALPGEQEEGRSSFHVGDLGNLFPAANGTANFDTLYEEPISTWALVGRSIVIHADRDHGHEAQPTGNAGARVAVCVIGRLTA